MSWTCAKCNAEYEDDVDSTEVDGDSWCSQCVEDHTGTCDYCHAIISNDDLVRMQGTRQDGVVYYCESCANDEGFTCQDCDIRYTNNIDSISYNDDYLCVRCYENSYFTCDSCDNICHRDNYASDGFYATVEDIEIPWTSEETELAYCDLTSPDED